MAKGFLTCFLLTLVYLSGVRGVSQLVVATDSSSLWTSPSPKASYKPERLPVILRRLSMLDPLSSAYLMLLARSLMTIDDPDAARSAAGAVRMDAINPAAWVLCGELEGRYGRTDEGFARCEKALSLNPSRPETYLRTGLYLWAALPSLHGDQRSLYRNLAEMHLDLSLALNDALASEAHLGLALASIAAEKGDRRRAASWLKRTVIEPPVDWPFAIKKLALCFEVGEQVEAIAAWKKLVRDETLSPLKIRVIEAEIEGCEVPDFAYLRADLHVRQGRLDLAREELSSLVAARPYVADYRLALGEVYEKLGLRREAMICDEKALELSPASQEAKKKVVEYYGKGGGWLH